MSTENQVFIFLILVAVLVFALSVNYVIYRRQVAAQQRRLRAKKIQGLLPDLLDCLSVLKQTECLPDISKVLERYAAEQLDELSKLAPSPEMQNQLENSRAQTSSAPLDPVNYKQVSQAVNKSTTVLKMIKSSGGLTPQQLDEYIHELTLVKLLSEAQSLLDLGKELHSQDKAAVAKNHLRQGRGIISKIPDTDSRKLKIRDEINDLLNGSNPVASNESNADSTGQQPPTSQAEAT